MHRLNATVAAAGRQWPLAARAATLAGLLVLAACTRTTSSEPQPGSYRATVEIAAGKWVPFGLDVAQEERGTVLYVINGDERIRLDELKVGPGTLEARFPGYETVLQARVAGEELTGEVLLPRTGGEVARLPFKATLGAAWRFFRTHCRKTPTSPVAGASSSRATAAVASRAWRLLSKVSSA